MPEDGGLRLQAGIVKMNEVGVQLLERDAQNAFYILAISGVHEVDPFAKALVRVEEWTPEVIGHDPLCCIRPFHQEGFISHSAADIDPDAYSISVQQRRQLSRIRKLRGFGLQSETFVEVNDCHADAQVLQFADRLFSVLSFVLLRKIDGLRSHACAKDRRAVPIANGDRKSTRLNSSH